MSLIRSPKTQPLAVGASKPTDCGVVLSQWAPESKAIALRCMGERLARRLYPVCASDLVPNQSPRQLPNINSGISPCYFPL